MLRKAVSLCDARWRSSLWLDDNGGAFGDGFKEFFHVCVVERYAAPRPIVRRAVAVNEDLAAQPCIPRRALAAVEGANDLVVLRAVNQPLAQAARRVRFVGIAQAERA